MTRGVRKMISSVREVVIDLEPNSAHHRGQLSAYLRPMGAKVPGIYGASGDTQ